MTKNVSFRSETKKDWDDQMNRKCKCGHLLYQHAFTMHPSLADPDPACIVLWTSQCTVCLYDREKEKFTCEGFDSE